MDKYAHEVKVQPSCHLDSTGDNNSKDPGHLDGTSGNSKASGTMLEMCDPCGSIPLGGSSHHILVNSDKPTPPLNLAMSLSLPTVSLLPLTPTLGPTVPDSSATNDLSESSAAIEGNPMDSNPDSMCMKNWKATQADEKKKSWDIFEENVVFVSVCPHGFILWIIDMV